MIYVISAWLVNRVLELCEVLHNSCMSEQSSLPVLKRATPPAAVPCYDECVVDRVQHFNAGSLYRYLHAFVKTILILEA